MYSDYVHVFTTFLICFLATIITGQIQRDSEQTICNKYNIREIKWTCKKTTDCKWTNKILNTTHEHRCASNKNVLKICCPDKIESLPSDKPPEHIQIIRKKCIDYAQARYQNVCRPPVLIGVSESCQYKLICPASDISTIIVGGRYAQEKEFPHMALIGYGDTISQAEWICGGSLISERFVMSAAQCNTNGTKWVALGLQRRKDATPEKLNRNIFRIVKTYNYSEYKTSYANHDITLYELENPVTLTPFLRPICLYTEYEIPKEFINNGIISGWGVTSVGEDVSDTLLKGVINFVPSQTCAATYAKDTKLKNGFDAKTMICAGTLKTDTCYGDAGGPLQISQGGECMYSQVGITSMGPLWCGDGTPAIYTRVSAYLEWIQKIVWPNGI